MGTRNVPVTDPLADRLRLAATTWACRPHSPRVVGKDSSAPSSQAEGNVGRVPGP